MGCQRQIEYDDGGRAQAASTSNGDTCILKNLLIFFLRREKKSSEIFDLLFNSLGHATYSYHAREGEEHEDRGRDKAFKTLHDAKEMIMRKGIHRWAGRGNTQKAKPTYGREQMHHLQINAYAQAQPVASLAGDGIGNVMMRGGRWHHHQHKHVVLLMVMTMIEEMMMIDDQLSKAM